MMNPPPSGPADEGAERTPPTPSMFSQELQHSHVSARVPEKIGRGVFSTGALIFQGPHEFGIDFVLRVVQPHQVVARVILPPTIIPSMIGALRENLGRYTAQFGPPPPLPTPPPPNPMPSVEEIYQQLKVPDEIASGSYANAVMIVHTPAEFCFDFITGFYPRSAVSARVFLAAPQIPGFLNSLTHAHQQYLQKHGGQPGQRPAGAP